MASVLRRGSSVSILADPVRARRYDAEGFSLNGERVFFPILPAGMPPQPGENPDLIIVAVKRHHLEEAIADMSPYVGPSTLILSLLNGITSEDDIAAAFGREKIPYAMILGIDAVREGSATTFPQPGRIHSRGAESADLAIKSPASRSASPLRDGLRRPYDMSPVPLVQFMIPGSTVLCVLLLLRLSTPAGCPFGHGVGDAGSRGNFPFFGDRLDEGDLRSWGALGGSVPDAKTSCSKTGPGARPGRSLRVDRLPWGEIGADPVNLLFSICCGR